MTTLAHYVADDIPASGDAWPQRVGVNPASLLYWTNSFREDSEIRLNYKKFRRITRTQYTSGIGGQALISMGAVNGADANLFPPSSGDARTYECVARMVSYNTTTLTAYIDLFSGYFSNADARFSFQRGTGSNSEKYRLNVRVSDYGDKVGTYTSSYFTFKSADFHYMAISVRVVSGVIRLTAYINETQIVNDVAISPAVGFVYPTFPSGSTAFFSVTESDFSIATPLTSLMELRITDELITQALATSRSRQLRIINARKA